MLKVSAPSDNGVIPSLDGLRAIYRARFRVTGPSSVAIGSGSLTVPGDLVDESSFHVAILHCK